MAVDPIKLFAPIFFHSRYVGLADWKKQELFACQDLSLEDSSADLPHIHDDNAHYQKFLDITLQMNSKKRSLNFPT